MMRPRNGLARPSVCDTSAGFSLIEVVIALAVVAFAGMALMDAMFGTQKLISASKENTYAMNAAREKLEEVRRYTFADIFAYYNNNAADDPGGAGTAPGNSFTVSGLYVQSGDTDGMAGRIIFPQSGTNLIETYVDTSMGMPSTGKDMNGDGVINSASRNSDYIVLPVKISIEWRSGDGVNRTYSLNTFITPR